LGGLEILPATEIIYEIRQRFVGVGETGVGEEPLVEPQDRTAGAGGEIEGGENEGRGRADVGEAKVESLGDWEWV
jgi:hypothetical protein